ncbi:palmitoyltransferase ZDHHC23 [Chelonus insularis]|uniref:palmitoyltransferase ZDHHC23 n=1 Tax=Chelonus insularis TaxID=460826 RepID=UPI001588F0F2|nr:palmitoyltransferase ZDHHC23 [Chelonus insularis]
MMISVWSKLRNWCGWRIGVKQISIDAVIPLLLPAITIIAAQSVFLTVIVFILTPIVVYHLDHNFLRFLPRSRFFLMWTITSVVMLMLVFEMCVVPLLEILPEENYVFITGVIGGIYCGHKTRAKADATNQDDAENQNISLESEKGSGELCITCRKKISPRTYHCRICQTCILGREYHCKWLDCCIGTNNLKWYLGCLCCSSVAFIYGSNLTMTSVCHPFILIGTILLPDDCSDVYHQLDLAVCFVSGVYSLFIGLIVLYYLIYHLWLLYMGTTTHERLTLNDIQSNTLLTRIRQSSCCRW